MSPPSSPLQIFLRYRWRKLKQSQNHQIHRKKKKPSVYLPYSGFFKSLHSSWPDVCKSWNTQIWGSIAKSYLSSVQIRPNKGGICPPEAAVSHMSLLQLTIWNIHRTAPRRSKSLPSPPLTPSFTSTNLPLTPTPTHPQTNPFIPPLPSWKMFCLSGGGVWVVGLMSS